MNAIVSRKRDDDENELALNKVHRSGVLVVQTDLVLGIQPKLTLSWATAESKWRKGFALSIFRSTEGFHPVRQTLDFHNHGRLIIESKENGTYEENVPEGTFYYTCILHRRRYYVLQDVEMVRFTMTVPSAKVAIGRIKDQKELHNLRQSHELEQIEHEAKLNEARLRLLQSQARLDAAAKPRSIEAGSAPMDRTVAEAVSAIDAMMDAFVAKRKKLDDVKQDPRFKKLSKDEKKEIVDRIQDRLDAGEIGAERDMRNS